MCRWFAYISDSEPALLEDVLVRPAHAITKQVHSSYLPKLFHHTLTKNDDAEERKFITAHNKFVNVDGNGVAFYSSVPEEYGQVDGLRPQLYKSTQPALNDPNYMSLVANNSSTAIMAHIRMSTSIVVPTNSHPFTFGRHSFMHNGTISNFNTSPTLKRRMLMSMSAKATQNVHGSTDSEHLAGLYMSFLGDDWERTYTLEEMREALEKAVQTVIHYQKEELDPKEKGSAKAEEPNSLNLCTTDGVQLLAFRFRDSPLDVEQPPSLYYSTTAGPTLNRKYEGHPDHVANSDIAPEHAWHPYNAGDHTPPPAGKQEGSLGKDNHGKHVIVASEPTTFNQKEWELIPKNTCVMVGKDMSVKLDKIKVEF